MIGPAAVVVAALASATPLRYDITLSPNVAHETFAGRETLTLALPAPTRTIRLDAVGLTLTSARVDGAAAKVTTTSDAVVLTLPSPIAGEVGVELAWSGRLADDLGGLFAADGHALFTHFEPAGARRVFPCIDAPAAKARFSLAVDVDEDDEAVSNTAPIARTPLDGHRVRVRFAETEPLPPYAVALAAGRFDSLAADADGHLVRVLAPPERLPLARFALDTATALLPRLAAWFGRDYPFAKLDLVAVPSLAPGGMENAGAIFLRDDRMLVDPAAASPATLHAVAMLIAHELAHQWLGNLVTPATWDDLWLAEATATYVAHEVVAAWHPDWRPWDELQPAIDEVMADDELAAVHPVRGSDGRPLFDAVVYTKGAALLRMLAGWIGPDALRDAFRELVRAHAFSTVAAGDLWRLLDDDAAAAARAWFAGRGHATLLTAVRCAGDGATVTIARQRAVPAWPLPVALRWPGGRRALVLDGAAVSTRLDGCPAWIDANADRVGFYRVRFEAPWDAALARAAASALEPAERVGLLSDAWLDVRDGAPLANYLSLAAALRGERSSVVLEELGRRLAFAGSELVRDGDRSAFERLVDDSIAPSLASLGWSARGDEGDDARLARARAVEILGEIAHAPGVVAEAERRLRRWLADPRSADGALADALVELGALHARSDRWNAYVVRMRAARTPEERERFREALTRFDRPALVQRTLGLLLTALVPGEALGRVAAELADNAHGRASAWRFWKSHFDTLERKAPRAGWLLPATQRFCSADVAREIGRFFATREPYPSLAGAVAETTERIASCAALRARAGNELAAFLHARYAEARSHAPTRARLRGAP